MYGMNNANGPMTGDYVTSGNFNPPHPHHHPPPSANINSPTTAYYSNNGGGYSAATNFYLPHQMNAAVSPTSALQYASPPTTVDLFGSNSYLFGYYPNNSGGDYNAWASSPALQHAAAAAASGVGRQQQQQATTTTSSANVGGNGGVPPASTDFYGYGGGAGLQQQGMQDGVYSSFATGAPPADMQRTAQNLFMYNPQQIEQNFGRLSFDDLSHHQHQQHHHQHLQAPPQPLQPHSVHQMMGAVGLGLGPAPLPPHHGYGGAVSQLPSQTVCQSIVQPSSNHQQLHQPPQMHHQQQAPAKKTWASIVKQPDKSHHQQQQTLGQMAKAKKIPIGGVTTSSVSSTANGLTALTSSPTSAGSAVAPPVARNMAPQPSVPHCPTMQAPPPAIFWTPTVGGSLLVSPSPTAAMSVAMVAPPPLLQHQTKPSAASDAPLKTSSWSSAVNGQRAANHGFSKEVSVLSSGGYYNNTAAGLFDHGAVNGNDPSDLVADVDGNPPAMAKRPPTLTTTATGARNAVVEASGKQVAGGGGESTPIFSSVLDKLRQENEYNPREFNLAMKNARYFVIKSYNEDDFHRSIKYGIWCSTEHGNKRLDQTFKEREGKGPVYIFASVNGSGHFCGVARMTSSVDYGRSVGVWAQDKYKGQFTVKWIYVKDVPNNQLRHIRLENNENKPVTNSRDTQEVPAEKGRQVLKIIHQFQHTTSLFDDFTHYEKREHEEEERKKRSHPHQ